MDKYDDEFRSFLRKSGVKYPIAFANKDMSNSYRVSSYPTMYLIDTQGNIIYSQVGYSKHHESALEEIIVKNLPKK
ncbi:MAG: hypothetical protein IPM69_10735 [Ignavibacteria bacterium]|nr:hypothetical protein [Ignavibacteria bacterium]